MLKNVSCVRLYAGVIMDKAKKLNLTIGIINIVIGVTIVLPSILSMLDIYQNKTTNSIAVAFAMVVVMAVIIVLGIIACLLFLLYIFFGIKFLQYVKNDNIVYKKIKVYFIINYVLDGLALIISIALTTTWLWVLAIDLLILFNIIIKIINHRYIIQNSKLNSQPTNKENT